MADDSETGGEDVGWWDCSLCTYRNSADKFKCEICDLRRGTSTRKPRNNADTIVAQVVKQQEQIRAQTKAKPSPKNKSSTSSTNPTAATASSSNDHAKRPKKATNKKQKTEGTGSVYESESSQSTSSSRVKKNKLTHHHTSHNTSERKLTIDTSSDNDESSDATDELSRASSPQLQRSASESSLSGSQYSSSSAMSPEPTTSSPNPLSARDSENPFKIMPFEINGNLIKYSPPTSSGRTGLIIDKKRFTQHSVTVNDVTITFTEFATRQNKYIRKKKKRRDGRPKVNGHSVKSRASTKSDSKLSSSNTASTAATGDV